MTVTSIVAAGSALYAGGPAYPANWNGGPPLPPVGVGVSEYAPAPVYCPPNGCVQNQVVYEREVEYAPRVHYEKHRVTHRTVVYQTQVVPVTHVVARWAVVPEPQQDFFWMPEFHPFGPYNDYVAQESTFVNRRVVYQPVQQYQVRAAPVYVQQGPVYVDQGGYMQPSVPYVSGYYTPYERGYYVAHEYDVGTHSHHDD